MRATLAKDLAEKDARARDNRRFLQGRVVAVNALSHTVRLDVGASYFLEDVPYTAQTPPNVGDIGDLVYGNSSVHSVRFTNPRVSQGNGQGSITIVGGVTTLRKAGDTLLKGDVTLSEGIGVTLTQVGQDIEIAAGSGTGARDTVAQATGSLADGGVDDTQDIATGKGGLIYRVETDYAARVRIYTTDAERAADLSRPFGVVPDAGIGLVVEVRTTPTLLAVNLTPIRAFANMETVPVGTLPMTVQNLSGSTHVITVTLTKLTLEL